MLTLEDELTCCTLLHALHGNPTSTDPQPTADVALHNLAVVLRKTLHGQPVAVWDWERVF